MKKLQPIWEEEVVFSWKNFDVIQQEYSDWEKIKLFEIAKRAPWVRLIILDEKQEKILLTKEYRNEIDAFDFRLPGGKVFDTKQQRDNADYSKIEEHAIEAAKIECREETWLIAKSLDLFTVSYAWATVSWDLYYFIVDSFEVNSAGQDLWTGEVITTHWYSFKEVITLCENWDIKEDRTLWVLFKYLLAKKAL